MNKNCIASCGHLRFKALLNNQTFRWFIHCRSWVRVLMMLQPCMSPREPCSLSLINHSNTSQSWASVSSRFGSGPRLPPSVLPIPVRFMSSSLKRRRRLVSCVSEYVIEFTLPGWRLSCDRREMHDGWELVMTKLVENNSGGKRGLFWRLCFRLFFKHCRKRGSSK